MAEAKLGKVERTNEALDRPNRVVRSDIVLNPRRKETGLLSALAGLECTIRHEPNRTSTPENNEFLPSLVVPIGRTHCLHFIIASEAKQSDASASGAAMTALSSLAPGVRRDLSERAHRDEVASLRLGQEHVHGRVMILADRHRPGR